MRRRDYQRLRLERAFERADREAALRAQGGRCKYCLVPLSLKDATRDHVIPRAKGGSNHKENTVAACDDCNNAKGDMDVKRFLRLIHDPKPGEPMKYRLIWFEWKLNLALIELERRIMVRLRGKK
jgi:5-methylcytosine-specific restriction endonuclease McrA